MSLLIGGLILVVLMLAALALLPHAIRGASVAWPLVRRVLSFSAWALVAGAMLLLSYLIPGPQPIWAWLASHDDAVAPLVCLIVAFVLWRLLEWWHARVVARRTTKGKAP